MKIHNTHIPYGGGKQKPKRVVIHAMAEFFPSTGSPIHAVTFLNEIKLSAHILVAPNGDIYKCRDDNEIAYHARGFNKDSLGIEFLVQGVHTYESFLNRVKSSYITNSQIESGISYVKSWLELHDIKSTDRHSDLSPERKIDPGEGFPWEYFIRSLGDVG